MAMPRESAARPARAAATWAVAGWEEEARAAAGMPAEELAVGATVEALAAAMVEMAPMEAEEREVG